MRVLFLNSVFPGQFRALARAYGAAGHTVLFLAEGGQKNSVLPGVRRLRLAPPTPWTGTDVVERECVLLLRRGARAGNALLGLRKQGFVPDLVIAAASMGGSFYVRDIFPTAFYVCYGDWFHTRESSGFFARGRQRPAVDFAPARVHNLWEYNALGDCNLAVTSSLWQRDQYPALLRQGIRVVHVGVNTRFFSPQRNDSDAGRELVTYCAPLHDPARGFAQFSRCLPYILARRPNCLVVLAWPGNSQAQGAYAHSTALMQHMIPDLPAAQRTRVRLLGPCRPEDYRDALRRSTVHVYLAAPHVFSTGLLEAMACGTLVLASDTPSVREVVRDGDNGFLCDFWDSDGMAQRLVRLLAASGSAAAGFTRIRRQARQMVCEGYDAERQAVRFMDLIAVEMANR